MMNGRLANQHDVKTVSRCRTIFGKQLRRPWPKRARFSPGKDQNKLSCDPIHLKNRFDWIDHFLRPFGTLLKSSKSIRQNWPQNWGKPQCGLVCRDSTLGSKGVVKHDSLHVKKLRTCRKTRFTTRGWCQLRQGLAPFTTRKQFFTTPEQDYSLIGHKRTIFGVAEHTTI